MIEKKQSHQKKYKYGLALSGGGARGFAHLGIIKALNEEGIFPDIITGVSAGAIAGAFYADGYSPDEIMKLFQKKKTFDFIKVKFQKLGFGNMNGMKQVLQENIRAKRFEDLKIPLIVAATDLNNAKIKYFSKGEIPEAVVASASIPVIFKPTVIDNIYYVDGGVLNNLAIEPLLDKCSKIIGVYVNPIGKQDKFKNMINIAERSFHIGIEPNFQEKKQMCDIFIEPKGLANFQMLSMKKADKIFDIGYVETKKVLEKL
ncbi:MAG: patatin-like phospholipase family protein [Bacteroidales bacterium]|nr:patatin-like phospholipase family protein [Bacteroidales bacterium]